MSNIFIPQKLKVGFNNRDGTYTGKLAYVIYYDNAGKLRKQISWENWRDKNIEPLEIDNTPISGFVLNKKVGGYQDYYNMRQTYIRVYDPRDFEFEITVPNLLYILENTSSIKGKGLEGDFVYGWDGTDLLLIPTSAPEYKEFTNRANTLYNDKPISAKDLKVGYTYYKIDGTPLVYIGKMYTYKDCEAFCYREKPSYWYTTYKVGEWSENIDNTWHDDIFSEINNTRAYKADYKYKSEQSKNKKFVFYKSNETKFYNAIMIYSSLPKNFVYSVSENPCLEYPQYLDVFEHDSYFNAIDYSATKKYICPFERFKKIINDLIPIDSSKKDLGYWYKDKEYLEIDATKFNKRSYDNIDAFYYSDSNKYVCYNKAHGNDRITILETDSIEELYDFIKPIKYDRYLTNGKQMLTERGWEKWTVKETTMYFD